VDERNIHSTVHQLSASIAFRALSTYNSTCAKQLLTSYASYFG
jgi:hypothetical protein